MYQVERDFKACVGHFYKIYIWDIFAGTITISWEQCMWQTSVNKSDHLKKILSLPLSVMCIRSALKSLRVKRGTTCLFLPVICLMYCPQDIVIVLAILYILIHICCYCIAAFIIQKSYLAKMAEDVNLSITRSLLSSSSKHTERTRCPKARSTAVNEWWY